MATGASVRFRVEVHNPGTAPVTLYLRGRTPTFDVIVERDGAVVWQRLADAVIPAIIQVKTLAPNERMTLEAEWRSPSGPGRYEAHALLLTDEPQPRMTNRVGFVVE